MRSRFVKISALAVFASLAFVHGAMALPRGTQIVRVSTLMPGTSMLRNGLRPVEDKNGKYGYRNAAGKLVVP